MSAVADLLARSRTAHLAARTAAARNAPADEHWRTALELRLEARRVDEHRFDAAWLEDALHPKLQGDTKRRYHRIPGKTVAQVAAVKDAELVAFFMARLAAPPESPAPLTDGELAAKVVIPTAYQVQTPGVTPCGCGHTKLMHTIVGQAQGAAPCQSATLDELGAATPCPCEAYAPVPCAHQWQIGDRQRRCLACDQVDQLVETKALEDTEAFKQLQREQREP